MEKEKHERDCIYKNNKGEKKRCMIVEKIRYINRQGFVGVNKYMIDKM
jgi:hypothetical protein